LENNYVYADLLFNNASRIIYFSQEKQHHFSVIHHGKNKLLVQSWITTPEGEDDVPFVVSPSLKNLEPDVPLALQIMLLSEKSLPSDRESVFYFYLNEIPEISTANNIKNKQAELTFAIKHRFYLFYRPKNIGNNSMENVNSLNWRLSKNRQGESILVVKNPYPFYYSLIDIELSDQIDSQHNMIEEHLLLAPLSTTEIVIPKNIAINKNSATLNFKVITDIGRGLPVVVNHINDSDN
jgi:P pilus assembly chaperone PapD